jgi:transcriptional regulator with XRE-family HTH domain
MIKNERQYRITSAEADRFTAALEERPESPPPGSEIHPRLWTAEREALRSRLGDLRRDLAAYRELREGSAKHFGVASLKDLPRALIQARIASGLTQKELAERLALPEQAVQRYEATDYSSASLERLAQVATAIGIDLSGLLGLPDGGSTATDFFARLKRVGLDRSLVLERILPPQIAAILENARSNVAVISGALVQAGVILQRVLGVDAQKLLASDSISLDPAVASVTRFKRAGRRTLSQRHVVTDGYTVYAHYLALLALQSAKHIPKRQVPKSAEEWRVGIEELGSFTLENVIKFFWQLGIPVLPLSDAGEFHGACWRTGGRDVVVLKQRSRSEDRWIYDALHEGGHITDEGEGPSFSIIESGSPGPGDETEERATEFAARVIFGGRQDELAELAVSVANGDIRRLEHATRQVAVSEDVPVGALANYLAFRVAQDTKDDEQINWWGTAERLQEKAGEPWRIARDIFLEHADLSVLTDDDRDLLVRALREQKMFTRQSRVTQ